MKIMNSISIFRVPCSGFEKFKEFEEFEVTADFQLLTTDFLLPTTNYFTASTFPHPAY